MEKITLETAKTGSELVLETLRDLGIDTIFWLSWWSGFAFIRCHL